MQSWTQAAVWECTAGVQYWRPDQAERTPLRPNAADGVPGEPRSVWVQLLKTVHGLADGTREWRNCFLAAARGLGFETSVLEPCVLVLRNTQQKYHGIVGLAVDDIAGGGDEVWEQAISKLKQRFTFGHWEVEKGKFCSREVVQAADCPCVLGSLLTSRAWTSCPWETEKGTIGRRQRERKNCHEIGAGRSRVFSP